MLQGRGTVYGFERGTGWSNICRKHHLGCHTSASSIVVLCCFCVWVELTLSSKANSLSAETGDVGLFFMKSLKLLDLCKVSCKHKKHDWVQLEQKGLLLSGFWCNADKELISCKCVNTMNLQASFSEAATYHVFTKKKKTSNLHVCTIQVLQRQIHFLFSWKN